MILITQATLNIGLEQACFVIFEELLEPHHLNLLIRLIMLELLLKFSGFSNIVRLCLIPLNFEFLPLDLLYGSMGKIILSKSYILCLKIKLRLAIESLNYHTTLQLYPTWLIK